MLPFKFIVAVGLVSFCVQYVCVCVLPFKFIIVAVGLVSLCVQ